MGNVAVTKPRHVGPTWAGAVVDKQLGTRKLLRTQLCGLSVPAVEPRSWMTRFATQ
jgi:hypothetical protein